MIFKINIDCLVKFGNINDKGAYANDVVKENNRQD